MGVYHIALDVHCAFSDMTVVDAKARIFRRRRLRTTISEIADALGEIPAPKHLTFEEGPMADWLYRGLLSYVNSLVVCEPRRNHLIAKDSDKDDPIDSEKLAQLFRGGYLKPVYHSDSLDRAVFKQHVALYHDRVRQKTREANRIMASLRRHGIFVHERQFLEGEQREALLARLPDHVLLHKAIKLLWSSYDLAREQVEWTRKSMIQQAQKIDQVRRFRTIPGIGWIRAATLYAYLDTPWRFHSKAALWRYLGIGLERRRSGEGPTIVRVAQNSNRVLRAAILGAAQCVIDREKQPFFRQYRFWMEEGLSYRNARRNVARSQAAALWSMWKNGSEFRPELVARREVVPTGA
jgi:transposase